MANVCSLSAVMPTAAAVRCVSVRRSAEFGSLRHLAGRFFGSLWPGGPSEADEDWARQWLAPGEVELWMKMSGPDRRHAVAVARCAIDLLIAGDASPGREVVASALLHDVGKVEAGLGTISRAFVTAAAMAVGRKWLATSPEPPAREARWRRRVRLYLVHDRAGATLLEEAGSDPVTIAWTREHHQDPSTWTLDPHIAAALKEADND